VSATSHDRVEGIGGPGGDQSLTGRDQRACGGAEQFGGAVAEDQAAGVDPVAGGQLVVQLGAAQMRVALQAALGDERDRADDARVGELRPGCLREIERLHTGQRLALALGGLRAQAHVDFLLGHAFELAVVVEQAHYATVVGLAMCLWTTITPGWVRRASWARTHPDGHRQFA
jgi:hypothetical protein